MRSRSCGLIEQPENLAGEVVGHLVVPGGIKGRLLALNQPFPKSNCTMGLPKAMYSMSQCFYKASIRPGEIAEHS
jgi:hypothetical protein